MKKLLLSLSILILVTTSAHALFLIENDDFKRPGRSSLTTAQVAGGNAINISFGIWEYSNLYVVFGSGAGLGWKQRLIQESAYTPFSWDLSAENTSYKYQHTTAYGTTLWKKLNYHINLFIKYESVENTDLWPGIPELGFHSITSLGCTLHILRNTKILLQGSNNPNLFGTVGVHVLL